MADEYIPTTDALRDLWVDHLLDPLPRNEGIDLVPDVQAEFDRWLAARDAERFSEGQRGVTIGFSPLDGRAFRIFEDNPYTVEEGP